MKKVVLHSRSFVRNRPIGNALICEFAQLGIAHMGIAQLEIRSLGTISRKKSKLVSKIEKVHEPEIKESISK
uniref:Uncharacterized protein n=1 Tax=Romanomermis culicivorax TaxID=13658 RepID=A0A915K5L2_ROMCU